ncbi:CLUMA_CG019294, isoform A [Clunio marinus]|uniref:CLUMA_CG019294, isoform A n=1 Tax=Clunio marinus TaxID=568069 RepID=A0A1J1J3I6_9DIPT|nr:CLUMA_CG019294, isoform A [Clunio marinus]
MNRFTPLICSKPCLSRLRIAISEAYTGSSHVWTPHCGAFLLIELLSYMKAVEECTGWYTPYPDDDKVFYLSVHIRI